MIAGWVTKHLDFTILMHSKSIGRGIDLTNWYKYQLHAVILHIHPEDGDEGDI
jgi:hypothetical protein